MRSLSMVVVMAACTSRAQVQVEVHGAPGDFLVGIGPPIAGAVIAFRDRDGTSRSTTTDRNGKASGEVEPGGSVWCSPSGDLLVQGTNALFAFDDVQAGDTLVFGAPMPVPASTATMTVTAQPPSPPPGFVSRVNIYTACTRAFNGTTIQLDGRCGSTVDVLAVAVASHLATQIYNGYQYLPAQPIVDGGTIAFPATGWLPLDSVSVQVTNVDGAMVSGSIGTFGFSAAAVTNGNTLTAQIPAVGTLLQIGAGLSTATGRQSITAVVSASAPTLDAHAIGTPYVRVDGRQTLNPTWSYDDLGGALRADAMLTRYQWSDNATCQEGNTAIVVRPPTAAGPLPALALPEVFACARPRRDLVVIKQVALVRIESAQGFDPLQAAMMGGLPAMGVGDSVAISEQ